MSLILQFMTPRGRTGQLVQLSRERSFPGSTVSTIEQPKHHQSISSNHEATAQHTRNVLISAERSDDGRLIGEDDFVVGVGREQALKKGNSRVEDDGAFHTSLDADLDLAVIHEVGADALNVGGGGAVEVGGSDDGA